MTDLENEFIAWALDPARTVEERYAIEVLTEPTLEKRVRETVEDWSAHYEQQRERREKRRYNPAYRPRPEEWAVREVAKTLQTLKTWRIGGYHDRPVRDLGILRFMPNLKELDFDSVEVDDLHALRHVPLLEVFSDGTFLPTEDYSGLGLCLNLKKVRISCKWPWLNMAGFDRLDKLEDMHWGGPAHSFNVQGIPILRGVRRLQIGHNSKGFRDFHQLPAMPELEDFWGEDFHRLDGIERFPKLRTLRVGGTFRTLEPLTAVRGLTHLRVVGDELREVASLAQLPVLRQIVIHSKRPQDYSVLAEAPLLRELFVEGCAMPQADAEMLNMVLAPWDEEFAAEQPRPLGPLELKAFPKEWKGDPEDHPLCTFPEGPDGWNGCPMYQESESRWVYARMNAALRAAGLNLRGVRATGLYSDKLGSPCTSSPPHALSHRHASINLLGAEALGRLRDIVECLRGVLAGTRWPWSICVMGDPEPDADEFDEPWRRENMTPEEVALEMIEEHKDYEERLRKEQHYLAGEFRAGLLEADGIEPNPDDFVLPPPPSRPGDMGKGGVATKAKPGDEDEDDDEPPPIPFEEPNLDWDKHNDEDDREGGLSEAEPGEDESKDEHWLKPPPELDPNVDWSEMRLYCTFSEKGFHIKSRWVRPLEYLLGMKAEWPPGVEPEEEDE